MFRVKQSLSNSKSCQLDALISAVIRVVSLPNIVPTMRSQKGIRKLPLFGFLYSPNSSVGISDDTMEAGNIYNHWEANDFLGGFVSEFITIYSCVRWDPENKNWLCYRWIFDDRIVDFFLVV